MTPLSFEWQWSTDYFIFMGLLYLALIIIGCGLVYSFMRTWLDVHYGEEPTAPPAELSYRSRYSEY